MTDSYDGILHWIQQADHDIRIDPVGNKDVFVSAIENYCKRYGAPSPVGISFVRAKNDPNPYMVARRTP